MQLIIEASIKTLEKSGVLLGKLTDKQLSDHSISPYYSCIGSHIRHILDFYDCILDGLDLQEVDLTDRKRDIKMHEDCNYAMLNTKRVILSLEKLKFNCKDTNILVIDDLGLGKAKIEYTLGALFAQANSHAIHHYAIINYILDRLGIAINDETFGYNPTTPRNITLNE